MAQHNLISYRWVIDLNVKGKTIMLVDDKIGGLPDFALMDIMHLHTGLCQQQYGL